MNHDIRRQLKMMVDYAPDNRGPRIVNSKEFIIASALLDLDERLTAIEEDAGMGRVVKNIGSLSNVLKNQCPEDSTRNKEWHRQLEETGHKPENASREAADK